MTTKARGRPRGRPKKAYTVRLDSVLADVLDMFTSIMLEARPTSSAAEVHEAIFHQFFFVTEADTAKYASKSRVLSARPARDILAYLDQYLGDRELAEEERWFFMHDAPTEEDVQRLTSEREKLREIESAAKELRLKQLRQYRASWSEEDQVQFDKDIKRVSSLLNSSNLSEEKK
jgi:hypothetical protein